jgi:molybdenum cofactor synthesis domain-containing protein
MRVAILTVSDRGAAGERYDESGDVLAEMARKMDGEVVAREIVPDERDRIESALRRLARKADLVLTTGGTGLSPRDVTPEATRAVIEKELPGFGEAMRMEGLKVTPRALLSRATAGTVGGTLIVNLPGSPKAVRECLAAVMAAIPHAIEIAAGRGGECGGSRGRRETPNGKCE